MVASFSRLVSFQNPSEMSAFLPQCLSSGMPENTSNTSMRVLHFSVNGVHLAVFSYYF